MTITTSHITMLIFFVLMCCSFAVSKRFPPYVEKCHRSDPNLKSCFIKAIDNIKGHFKRGIPEFGFPPMSPLVIPQVSLDNGNSFKATFHDLKVDNLENLQVEDVVFNFEENSFYVKVFIPHLRISSNYEIQGRLLFLQLAGSGPADGNLTKIDAEVTMQAQRYKKLNKEYFKFTTLKIQETIDTAHFKFEGLFRDNPELTERTNEIVNENIHDILEELRPSIHLAIQQVMLEIIGRLFNKFSVQELFPE